MPMLNYPDIFTSVEMTLAVNKLPLTRYRFAPLFESRGVRTTSVEIDLKKGRIVLVADSPRGSVPESKAGLGSTRSAKILPTCHLAMADAIRPEDIQDVRAFGMDEPISAASVINDKMSELKDNVEMTCELHRLGAIKGQVLDADGTTVLYDLFKIFNASKKSVSVPFPTTEKQDNPILAAITSAKRHCEASMGGVPLSRMECVIGADFYDKLTGHGLVRSYFEDWLARQQDFGDNDYRKRGFIYGGVTFFEASEVIGGRQLVEADKGHLYPVAPGVFTQFFAPADWMETANTIGQPFYAQMWPIEANRGYHVEVQSNPLTLCTFPEALVELSVG